MPTSLRNVRAGDELYNAAGAAARAQGTDLSTVARDAWQALIDRQNDPLWQEALALAAERGTTVEEVQRKALEQWVARVKRSRERSLSTA
jgi:hypothetical protein